MKRRGRWSEYSVGHTRCSGVARRVKHGGYHRLRPPRARSCGRSRRNERVEIRPSRPLARERTNVSRPPSLPSTSKLPSASAVVIRPPAAAYTSPSPPVGSKLALKRTSAGVEPNPHADRKLLHEVSIAVTHRAAAQRSRHAHDWESSLSAHPETAQNMGWCGLGFRLPTDDGSPSGRRLSWSVRRARSSTDTRICTAQGDLRFDHCPMSSLQPSAMAPGTGRLSS